VFTDERLEVAPSSFDAPATRAAEPADGVPRTSHAEGTSTSSEVVAGVGDNARYRHPIESVTLLGLGALW